MGLPRDSGYVGYVIRAACRSGHLVGAVGAAPSPGCRNGISRNRVAPSIL